MDDLFADVTPTPWGAVITDGRFPRIWDANYARIDAASPRLRAADIEHTLLPKLRAAGSDTMHVVSFDPEATTGLLSELSTRGHRLVWDLVMEHIEPPRIEVAGEVVEIATGSELWDAVRASLAMFGGDTQEALDQLHAIETDVLTPGGKRWFGVREGGRIQSLAAVVVLAGVGYLDNVATFPQARGRGFASAISLGATRWARGAGASHVVLLADPDEPAVVKMYERLGFREVGRLASTRGPLP